MSVSVASTTEIGVHTGFWTNWTHGKVRGATITLSRRDASLLVSFIALFVGVAGKSVWRIICFGLHHCLSSEVPQDGLYHQRQAILRNSGSATDGAWRLARSFWVWKRRAERPYRRLLTLVFMTIFTAAALGTAGVFSSHFSSSLGNEVLVSSQVCGQVVQDTDAKVSVDLGLPEIYQRTVSASNYALQCYANISASADCGTFVRNRLPTTVVRNASCPFSEELCLSKSKNILLDTGYLDSHHHLGINSPPGSRFWYRFVTHCAPIVTEGFSERSPVANDSRLDVMRYYYGVDIGVATRKPSEAYTYQYPMHPALAYELANASTSNMAMIDYDLGSTMFAASNLTDWSDFIAIPQLRRANADTSLFFLSANYIHFEQEINDLWFAAHRRRGEIWKPQDGGAVPVPSFAQGQGDSWGGASVLGCTSAEQYCNPNLPNATRCEPLRTQLEANDATFGLWRTESEKQMYAWLMPGLAYSGDTLINILGTSALTARYSLVNGVQSALPDNQWQREVEHWHAASLATLQAYFVHTATGPQDRRLEPYLLRPNNTEQHRMCKNQKILSTAYSSFSVLGLSLVLGIGTLLITLDYSLESLVSWVQRRYNLDVYGRLEWSSNELLQLQRLAHEEIGVGTWSRTAEDYPVTEKGERLATLDVGDIKHPVLKPVFGYEEESGGGKGSNTTVGRQESDEVGGGDRSTDRIAENGTAPGQMDTISGWI